MESKDLAGELVDPQGGVASNVQVDIPMASVGADPENRFAIYRSPASQPFTAFERIYTSGENVPTIPGNTRPLQVVEGGQLQIEVSSAKFTLNDLRREASFKRDRVFARNGGDQFKVELEAVGKATLPDDGNYRWTLQIDDGPVLQLPNARNSILWLKLDSIVENLNRTGLTDTPVIFKVAEINANRRARLTVRAQVTGLTANPERYDMAVVLSMSILSDSPDWKPGFRLPENPTQFNQAYPLYSLFESGFAPATPANVQTFINKTGAAGLAVRERIHWTFAPPEAIVNTFASTYAVSGFNATDFTKPFEQAGARWTRAALGTACTPLSEATDWEDLQGTLEHEFFHAKGQIFKQRPPYGPSEEWSYNYETTMFNFMSTNLWALAPQERRNLVADYVYAAHLYIHTLMELEAHGRFALRVPTSNFMLHVDFNQLARHLGDMARLLRNGVPDTLRTFPTRGMNVTPAHRNETLIPLTNYVWNLLPPQLRPGRGPEISLADPSFETKLPKAGDVWLPKFKP